MGRFNRKSKEVDHYVGKMIVFDKCFNRVLNSDIKLGSRFQIKTPPEGCKNDMFGVWIKFKGELRKVLLAEVSFIQRTYTTKKSKFTRC